MKKILLNYWPRVAWHLDRFVTPPYPNRIQAFEGARGQISLPYVVSERSCVPDVAVVTEVMGDIVYHLANYADIVEELEKLVEELGEKTVIEQRELLADAREKMRRVATAKKSVGLEARVVARERARRDRSHDEGARGIETRLRAPPRSCA